MEGGWRIKRMHRLILLSSAYRMSSRATPEQLAKDPGNRWFWRFPMRRLAAEEVRDSILTVSGTLNDKAGGPSVYPPIPREVLAGQSIPGNGWPVSTPAESARRSVYIHVKRSLASSHPGHPRRRGYRLELPGALHHDRPRAGARACSTASSPTSRPSGSPTGCDESDPATWPSRSAGSIRLTTGLDPHAEEVARDLAWIKALEADLHLSEHAALTQYCLLSLNANAFLYLD